MEVTIKEALKNYSKLQREFDKQRSCITIFTGLFGEKVLYEAIENAKIIKKK